MNWYSRGLNGLQKTALSLMAVLTLLTFVAANLHTLLWQSSQWLVSTVLPSVVVELTNEERSAVAATPLRRNPTLDAAAQLKAEHMAENEYFSHFSPEGVSPWHWFDEAGYTYAHAGENLAIHFTDSAEMVEAWMESPTHRANIVNGQYTEIGVGTAKGEYEGYDTVYVVQLFGTPGVADVPQSETVAVEEEVSDRVVSTAEPADTAVATTATSSTLAGAALSEAVTEPALPEEEPETPSEATTSIAQEKAVQPADDVDISDAAPVATDTEAAQMVPPDTTVPDEVVVVESSPLATSSGLMAATDGTTADRHAGATVASIVTQPNVLLERVYAALGVVVVVLLSLSVILEARRFRMAQVAYGMLLLLGMGVLWSAHSLLTSGAVIV